MSTYFYGSTVSSCWRAYGLYSTSESSTSMTISLTGGFQAQNWRFAINYVNCTATIGSSSTTTTNNAVSTAGGSDYYAYTSMASASKTITKTTSAQTISLSVVTYNHSSYKDGTSTASTTVTVPALASYTVSYNANGGSGAPSSQTKYYGVSLTLSTTKPTRTNYNFLGWSTSSSATSATYAAGATYTANASISLYAVWELAHTSPVIMNLSVYRCDSDGSASDTGEYCYTYFTWTIYDDYTVSSIKAVISSNAMSSSVSATISASGTSGTVSGLLASSSVTYDADYDYTIVFTVTDSASSSTTKTAILASTKYTIDLLAGGRGIAFGKASTEEELFDCEFPVLLEDSVTLESPPVLDYMDSVSSQQSYKLPVVTDDNELDGYLIFKRGSSSFSVTATGTIYSISTTFDTAFPTAVLGANVQVVASNPLMADACISAVDASYITILCGRSDGASTTVVRWMVFGY